MRSEVTQFSGDYGRMSTTCLRIFFVCRLFHYHQESSEGGVGSHALQINQETTTYPASIRAAMAMVHRAISAERIKDRADDVVMELGVASSSAVLI